MAASLAQAAESLSHYFATAKSIQFKAVQETVVPSTGVRFTENFQYVGAGEFYRYHCFDGRPEFDDVVAFNGDYGQLLNSGELKLQKGKRLDDGQSSTVLGVLEAFSFFSADEYEGFRSAKPKFYLPTLAALSSVENWKRRLGAGTTPAMVNRKGKALFSVTMPGGGEWGTTMKTTFQVFFDPATAFFPIAWERSGTLGESHEVYEVEELASVSGRDGKSFFYPKSAIRYLYYGDDRDYYWKKSVLVSDMIFGQEYDKDTFTIDPSSADHIHDLDTKTYIKVPK